MQGGTGRDGDTQLAWIDPVEMGGTLLLEASGVTLANRKHRDSGWLLYGRPDSAGMHRGLSGNCSARHGRRFSAADNLGLADGQRLSGKSGQSVHACGYAFIVLSANAVLAVYRSYGDSGAISYGGQWNIAPAKLQFEIQEFVNGVAGMPVTLYDGQIASLPGACTVVAASSINLVGTMRALQPHQSWIRLGGHHSRQWQPCNAPSRYHSAGGASAMLRARAS